MASNMIHDLCVSELIDMQHAELPRTDYLGSEGVRYKAPKIRSSGIGCVMVR